MYKVVWIARFKSGLDRDTARRHWSEVHGALARRVPGIERYVQNHARSPLHAVGVGEGPLGFDGYSCCWYASREAFHASLRTSEWSAVAADGPNVFAPDSLRGMSAGLGEVTIVDGEPGPFKTVWIVRFKDEIRASPERMREAHEYWIETHGRHFGRRVPGIGRYVQNHAVEAVGPSGVDEELELRFDGFSECWFRDRSDYELAMASPEWAAMNEDALNLFDLDFVLGEGMSALLDERVVKDSVPGPRPAAR